MIRISTYPLSKCKLDDIPFGPSNTPRPVAYKITMRFTLSNPYKVCKDTADTTITVAVPSTGIQNPDAAGTLFAVHPNPAKDIVNINWTKLSDDMATSP